MGCVLSAGCASADSKFTGLLDRSLEFEREFQFVTRLLRESFQQPIGLVKPGFKRYRSYGPPSPAVEPIDWRSNHKFVGQRDCHHQ